jgi:hypothetical protein
MSGLVMELREVRAYIDISSYWLKDKDGELRSVNSVYEEIKGSPDEVGRNTLRLALDGNLDRGYFLNAVKLARLCSQWSGKQVSVGDLLQVDESN